MLKSIELADALTEGLSLMCSLYGLLGEGAGVSFVFKENIRAKFINIHDHSQLAQLCNWLDLHKATAGRIEELTLLCRLTTHQSTHAKTVFTSHPDPTKFMVLCVEGDDTVVMNEFTNEQLDGLNQFLKEIKGE